MKSQPNPSASVPAASGQKILYQSTEPSSGSASPANPSRGMLNGRLLDGYHDVPGGAGASRLAQRYRQRLAASDQGAGLLLQAHGHGDTGGNAAPAPGRPEIIVGENNLLPFDFLRTGDRLGRAVVKIVRADGAAGTGFLVAPGVLLTNHHVLPDAATAAAATATANYEATPSADAAGRVSVVPLRPAELFVTSADLDFSFCAVRGLDYLGSVVPERNGLGVLPNEFVNIIQHPRGGIKQVALQDNQVEQSDRVVLRYTCDTEPGSSGSPVFNNQWRLLALHHASVEVGEGDGRRFLNEGIRLSAIGLWLDSEAASKSGRPDQVARVRTLFRGVDPRVGLFGALGRRSQAETAAQMVVEWYSPDGDILDLAYWDLGLAAGTGPARLEALAWVVADLGVDLWCLAGLDAEPARALCDNLAQHLGLEYQAVTLPADPGRPGSSQSLTLLTRRARRLILEPFALGASASGDEPIRVLVRAADRLDRVIRLVLAPPGSSAARRGGAATSSGAALRFPHPQRWFAGLTDLASDERDAILLGPGAPATPGDLDRVAQSGLVIRAAAVGPDGSCVLVSGDSTRIAQAVVSPNLVPVSGGSPEIVAAVDRDLPAGIRRVAACDPLALRLVFSSPRPTGEDSVEPFMGITPASSPPPVSAAVDPEPASTPVAARVTKPEPAPVAAPMPTPLPAAPLERALANLIAPLLAKWLTDMGLIPPCAPVEPPRDQT